MSGSIHNSLLHKIFKYENYNIKGKIILTQKHAFSIDLEDWYQGIELTEGKWKNKEHRLEKGLNIILQLLDETSTKATFFSLGWIAKNYGNIIKKIAGEGHEIASHGFSHDKIYNLTPETFRQDIKRTKALLEDVSGQEVLGNRSPFFSITKESLFALDILDSEGFTYDCSISPVQTWRYGIKSSPGNIYKFKELNLIEFPVSTTTFFFKKISIGGAYFRIFPYFVFKKALKKSKDPKMFYCHPWEYDPYHPSISFDRKARFTHYFNLKSMREKTRKLLNEFSFTKVSTIIAENINNKRVLEISVKNLQD
jgi:polysaccharide deacetylase family protein (PEP-CTERM system associated)